MELSRDIALAQLGLGTHQFVMMRPNKTLGDEPFRGRWNV
jgi:hypothetical protein